MENFKESSGGSEKPEKIIESTPKLQYITKTLELLRPEIDELGNEINWKELYKEVEPWQNGLELADNIRQVVYDYVSLKVPALKDGIPSIGDLRNNDIVNALAHNWSEEISDVSGQRREILMAVAAQVVKRIETLVYKRILAETKNEDLEIKLGLDPKLRNLLIGALDASQRADPLFVRFLAFTQLSPRPPEEATSTAMFLPEDDTPYTIASLFPHETQSIAKNLTQLSENSDEWGDFPGADTFKQYLKVLGAIYGEKDPTKAEQYLIESERLYGELLASEFPIIISSGMREGSYSKEPYIDPELKISISTPDARLEESNWRMAQKGMSESLVAVGLGSFADEMKSRTIRSVVNIGGHGANLVFNAVADEEPGIVVFLNEQVRAYDRNFSGFMGIIKNRDEIFNNISDPDTQALVERMSRSNTVHHELAHSIYKSSLPESKRLGLKPLTIIDEVKAETLYRSLIPSMIERATLSGDKKEWALGMLTTSLQMVREQDSSDPYYKAATYTLNDLLEDGAIKFENNQVEIIDFDKFYQVNDALREELINLYKDESMTEEGAVKWLKQRCQPSDQAKGLIDFLKNNLVELKKKSDSLGVSKFARLESLEDVDETAINDLVQVDKAAFPEEMNLSVEDMEEIWKNEKNIRIVLKDVETNKMLGYVLGVLPESEVETLQEWDPDFSPRKGDLYVESVAVIPETQSKGAISYLYDRLMEKAKELGFKRILRHGRRSTSSPIIKYKYKVEPLRTIENWQGWGEPFDYFEIPVE